MRIGIGSYFQVHYDDTALTGRIARLRKISRGDASRNTMKRDIQEVLRAFEEHVKQLIRAQHSLTDPAKQGFLESLQENTTYELADIDLDSITAVEERLAAKLKNQAPIVRCRQRGCQQWALIGGQYCRSCQHDL